jgi:hypothetical protein
MLRVIRGMTGFLFGFAIAILGALAMLPRAHGAETETPQLVIVVGYKDGHALGGQVLGIADSLSDCEMGLAQLIPTMHPKAGVSLVAVCTPLPPAPAVVHHQGEESI